MLFKRCFNRAEMKFILLFYNNKLNKCGRSMLPVGGIKLAHI